MKDDLQHANLLLDKFLIFSLKHSLIEKLIQTIDLREEEL
jgi:hypothetical protein